TKDGGYLIGATAENSDITIDKSEDSKGMSDFWVIKLDSNANIVWDKTIGGPSVDGIGDLIELANGNILISGASSSQIAWDKSEASRGLTDTWLVLLDSNGRIIWDKTIGGNLEDGGRKIVVTQSGRIFIAGTSNSTVSGDKLVDKIGLYDCWLLEINDTGSIIHQEVIGGTGNDAVVTLLEAIDGSLTIAMQSNSGTSGDRIIDPDKPYYGQFWILNWSID
ncbi:MAG: T9SS C-terminal target domain-containing protein, partial [Bacteroidota bacterium]|nr:T9SS C-terminal target domain-containing protein [Bacteroidota bacterium]